MEFLSDEPGATVLTGASGSLIAVLEPILLALGWTKPFTGTNKAVFQNTSGRYVRCDDSIQDAGDGACCRINAYETMSDVDTGTGPYPLNVGDIQARKSTAMNDTEAHAWYISADPLSFYCLIQADNSSGNWYDFAAGDYYDYADEDPFPYRGFCAGRITPSPDRRGPLINVAARCNAVPSEFETFALQRSYDGSAGAIQTDGTLNEVGMCGSTAASNGVAGGRTQGPLPIPNVGRLMLAELHLFEVAVPTLRGKMRGLWHFCHQASASHHMQEFDGAALLGLSSLEGRAFRLFLPSPGQSQAFCFETGNTWDTNA